MDPTIKRALFLTSRIKELENDLKKCEDSGDEVGVKRAKREMAKLRQELNKII